jgi:hypothetical protein
MAATCGPCAKIKIDRWRKLSMQIRLSFVDNANEMKERMKELMH